MSAIILLLLLCGIGAALYFVILSAPRRPNVRALRSGPHPRNVRRGPSCQTWVAILIAIAVALLTAATLWGGG